MQLQLACSLSSQHGGVLEGLCGAVLYAPEAAPVTRAAGRAIVAGFCIYVLFVEIHLIQGQGVAVSACPRTSFDSYDHVVTHTGVVAGCAMLAQRRCCTAK